MFKPVSLNGKLFHQYLKAFKHPAKIRIQNLIGKSFNNGLSIKNEHGVLFTLDANDWITRTILLEGNYESASTSLAKKILTEGGVFLDVGANFGLFTCIAASNNDKVNVVAVEPNYKVVSFLLNNIRANGLGERVQVLNTAVSKKTQFVTMEQPFSDNLGTTVTREGTNGLLSVLSCSLEFICNVNNITEVTLLKIDIEGNEFDILKDFPFDKYSIRNIILEFNHLSSVTFGTLQSFFEERGFKFFTVAGEALLNEQQGIPDNNIWIKNQQ